MYAIKKPSRAMTAMFAGLLNVVYSADVENYTNPNYEAMPKQYVKNPAELSLLDYLNVLFMIFTTIMMLLYGWVIFRRGHRHQADQPEPEEETAPTGVVPQKAWTPEDEATFLALQEEVKILRDYRESRRYLEAEIVKKQKMLVDARDEARLWKAKYENLRPDFVRMLEDTEIYILPHSNVWHADLNCLYGRTYGGQTIYGCEACRACAKHIGLEDYNFQNDPRASAPPGARRIGERAAARMRGSFEDD